jgi:hypothetical protein
MQFHSRIAYGIHSLTIKDIQTCVNLATTFLTIPIHNDALKKDITTVFTRRVSSMSNSNLYCKAEGCRVKNEGLWD